MAGLVFFFEDYDVDVWSGREIDLDTWFTTAHNWDFEKLAVINLTTERMPLARAGLQEYSSWEEFSAANPEPEIYLDTNSEGAISLWDYDHSHYWYCFGPSAGWKDIERNYRVYVPQKGVDYHHAPFIASIVGADRWNKLGWQ